MSWGVEILLARKLFFVSLSLNTSKHTFCEGVLRSNSEALETCTFDENDDDDMT
jgi:hypothetical protein